MWLASWLSCELMAYSSLQLHLQTFPRLVLEVTSFWNDWSQEYWSESDYLTLLTWLQSFTTWKSRLLYFGFSLDIVWLVGVAQVVQKRYLYDTYSLSKCDKNMKTFGIIIMASKPYSRTDGIVSMVRGLIWVLQIIRWFKFFDLSSQVFYAAFSANVLLKRKWIFCSLCYTSLLLHVHSECHAIAYVKVNTLWSKKIAPFLFLQYLLSNHSTCIFL